MLTPKQCKFCKEFYVIEKSIEVEVELKNGGAVRIRIDALRDTGIESCNYSTSAYIRENITVQPTYPQSNGVFIQQLKNVQVWNTYDLPWVSQGTADDALAQALQFLADRCEEA